MAPILTTGAGKFPAAAGGLDAATTAWINAVVADGGAVSANQQTRVDALIVGLKADSLFTLGDRLWLYAGESDTHQAKIDLINLQSHTLISTPTLAAGGYTGNGSSTAINTNFNPSTATQFVQNSASFLLYDRTSRGSNNEGSGGGDGSQYVMLYPQTGGTLLSDLNDISFPSTANADARGSWIGSRTGSANFIVYKNGSSLATLTATSAGRPNASLYVGAINGSGTPQDWSADQIAAVWFGAGLNGTQAANLASRINTYMTAWGINVY